MNKLKRRIANPAVRLFTGSAFKMNTKKSRFFAERDFQIHYFN
jgi:hypothetical protein